MSLLDNNPLGNSKASKHKDSKTSKTEAKKVRNTYSMHLETSHQLDEYKLKLRRLTGENVTKTEIVEAALIAAFKEYDRLEERSSLAIEIAKMIR